jgi:hypothetical protein
MSYNFGDLFQVNCAEIPFHRGATTLMPDGYHLTTTVCALRGDIMLFIPDPNNRYIIFLHPVHGLISDGFGGLEPCCDYRFVQEQLLLLKG